MPNWVNLPLIFNVTINEPTASVLPQFRGLENYVDAVDRRAEKANGLEISHDIGNTALDILIIADFHARVGLFFDEMLALWVSPAFEQGNEHFYYGSGKRLLVPRR